MLVSCRVTGLKKGESTATTRSFAIGFLQGDADTSPSLRYPTLTVVIVLCLWGLATHGTHAGSGDEPHYLAIAHSLAFDGDLDLANNYGRREPLIAGGTLEPGDHVRVGRRGVLRPVHDIGLPLVFAPYVRLVRPLVTPLLSRADHPVLKRLRLSPSTAYRHLLSAATIVIAVLLVRLMFTVFVAVGSPPSTAFWTTLLVALSPPLLIFSILLFTELTSALLCLFVFRQIAAVIPSSLNRRGIHVLTSSAIISGGKPCVPLATLHLR